MAIDAEKAPGEIMGQQDALATLFIKYAPEFFKDREEKKAAEEQKESAK